MCIRIKSKRKTMNLFFSFEKYLYLYLKYFQKYLYLNTFTNECICICIWPNEKYLYLYLNTFQCIWPHLCSWPLTSDYLEMSNQGHWVSNELYRINCARYNKSLYETVIKDISAYLMTLDDPYGWNQGHRIFKRLHVINGAS